jgi:hypothetical protein
MIHVITSANRHLYQAELLAHFDCVTKFTWWSETGRI